MQATMLLEALTMPRIEAGSIPTECTALAVDFCKADQQQQTDSIAPGRSHSAHFLLYNGWQAYDSVCDRGSQCGY
jgi:hypothetical protein